MNRQCSKCAFVTLKGGFPSCAYGYSLSRRKFCLLGKEAPGGVQEMKGRRVCPKCGKALPASEFYRNASYPDGLDCYCRHCKKGLNMMYAERRELKDMTNEIKTSV